MSSLLSISDVTYRQRLVEPLLDELMEQLPAVLVVGPRASGKTTTISRRAKTVVRLDREAEAAVFRADPDVALAGLAEPVLIDEWQNVPAVLGAVRRSVESDARPNRFFVTGSVRAELEAEVWPGTGRLVRIAMYPMTVREIAGSVTSEGFVQKIATGAPLTPPRDPPNLRGYIEVALRSGFPMPALALNGRPRQVWLESYIDDLLTHDVEQVEEHVTRRRDVQRLRRYFEVVALNSAGVVPHQTIYQAAGINRLTAIEYDELLDALLILEQVPSWSSNRLKRLVRQSKRYVIDAALVASVLRLDVETVLRDSAVLGRVLETFVAAQLRPELAVSSLQPRLYHLRSEQGRREVDLVVELGGERIVAIEVKAASAPRPGEDDKHLRWLRDELGDRFIHGVLLHTGPRLFSLDDRLIAAPIATLWSA